MLYLFLYISLSYRGLLLFIWRQKLLRLHSKWSKWWLMSQLPRFWCHLRLLKTYKRQAKGQSGGYLLRKWAFFLLIHIHAVIFFWLFPVLFNAYPKFRNTKLLCLYSSYSKFHFSVCLIQYIHWCVMLISFVNIYNVVNYALYTIKSLPYITHQFFHLYNLVFSSIFVVNYFCQYNLCFYNTALLSIIDFVVLTYDC
jgi:hypothetical protein